MKTTLNIKKGYGFMLIALLTLTTSFSVFAQKSIDKIVLRKDITVTIAEPLDIISEPAKKNMIVEALIVDQEAPLEVEDWMLNTESWNINSTENKFEFNEEVIEEEEIKLESWMFNFDIENPEYLHEEPEIALEDWMYSF